jgi:pentatricopeptide repeat protein
MEPPKHKRPGANRRRTKPGPKPVVPSADQRDLVTLGVAVGMTGDQIATAMEIPRRTFYRAFGHEIRTGRAKRLLLNASRLDEMAERGNVSAAKYLHDLMLARGVKPETADDNEWEAVADEIRESSPNLAQNSDFKSIN